MGNRDRAERIMVNLVAARQCVDRSAAATEPPAATITAAIAAAKRRAHWGVVIVAGMCTRESGLLVREVEACIRGAEQVISK